MSFILKSYCSKIIFTIDLIDSAKSIANAVEFMDEKY